MQSTDQREAPNTEHAIRNPPCRLPLRATVLVKSWLDYKGFGFLCNPDPADKRDIFIHHLEVPIRPGIGPRLLAGETVAITYVNLPDGRLRATKVEFPK